MTTNQNIMSGYNPKDRNSEGYWEYPENSEVAVDLYDDIREDWGSEDDSSSEDLSPSPIVRDTGEINKRLINALKYGMEDRDCFQLYFAIGAIRLFERDGVEISQPVWQLAYTCIVYCIENKSFSKQWIKRSVYVGPRIPRDLQNVMHQIRLQILAKLSE
jgi:hypothetical protein